MDAEPRAHPLKVRAVQSTMAAYTSCLKPRSAKALPTGFAGTVWQECPTCDGTGQEERFSAAGFALSLGVCSGYLATCRNCRGVGHVIGPAARLPG